jgi:hypothetical protein
VEVKSRAVKQRLIYLASRFQFLDRGFAEYFQTVVPSFDRDYVRQRLEEIRHEIARGQSPTPTGDEESANIYLGDLGEFCERVSHLWNHDPNNGQPGKPMFNITHRRDQEIFEYLQDAFEVPYWELMLDNFLHWRANSISLSGDIVIRVLEGLEREIRTGRRQLISDVEGQSGDTLQDLAPILEGIDARLQVLGTVCDMNEPLLLEMEDLVTASPDSMTICVEEPSPVGSPGPEKEKVMHNITRLLYSSLTIALVQENVVLITLILLFLTAAIVPGYKAFSISMKSSTPGSIEDADFWYLIQSSIMSVLGSLTMVIPLMKKSWFSPAYGTMWMFFTLGLSFAVIAIVIYPLVNTGWSSMVAFFGSIASVASVLIMTQAAAKDVLGKLKND